MRRKMSWSMHCAAISLLMYLGVLMPQGVSHAASAKVKKELNANLEKGASQLARLLSKPAFRKFLLQETQASQNREQILVFEKTITKARGRPDLGLPPGILKKLLETVGGTKLKMKEAQYKIVGVNVYFPVESHRKKWQGEADLLVAFVPVEEDLKKSDSITAFSAKTGERVSLKADKPPDTPLLVVAPQEHRTLKRVPPLRELPEPLKEISSSNTTSNDSNSYIGIPQLKLINDGEHWLRGNPEIYVLVGQVRGSTPIRHEINLAGVNDTGRWYWLGDRPILSSLLLLECLLQ